MAMSVSVYSPEVPEVTERVWLVSGQTADTVAPATAPPL
jgi:hypothetical protein